jgi:lactate dehydrogenase-like 2-hydroxyacid dehydrogenase
LTVKGERVELKDIEILQMGFFDDPAGDEALARAFTVHRLWDAKDPPVFLEEIGPRIRGLTSPPYPQPIDAELLATMPNLEIISMFAAGYDAVHMPTVQERGIMVTNTPGAAAEETADCAMGLLLSIVREFPRAQSFLRSGQWQKGVRFPRTMSLRNRTVGILGFGRIGKAIAERCKGFGLEVVYHGRSEQPDVPYRFYSTVLEMALDVDILFIAAPGTPETDNMVNTEILAALGPKAILVNVGRGNIVDEPALITALKDQTIFGAGLDVFANEPLVSSDLMELENALVLPHIGGASIHSWTTMCKMMVDNLTSWFSGNGPVTPVPETPFIRPR